MYYFQTFCSCFRLEEKLQSSHLPEMVFGDSSLFLFHARTGIKLHYNAFDALKGWMQEALPPVEVPAAAKWKFRRSVDFNSSLNKFKVALFLDHFHMLRMHPGPYETCACIILTILIFRKNIVNI